MFKYIGGVLMRSNYHTHTYRCNHATGTIEDYVKEAIKANIDMNLHLMMY